MAVLLIASQMPGAGKTAVAAALAMCLASDGRPVIVSRIAGEGADPNAADDARVFAALHFAQQGELRLSPSEAQSLVSSLPAGTTLILEAPREADIPTLAAATGARVVLVYRGRPALWPDAPPVGDGPPAGSIALAVPAPFLAAAGDVLRDRPGGSLGAIPEDRGLFGPSIREIVDITESEVIYDSGEIDEVMEHLVIAPISSDGGRPYFWRYSRKAVVTRVDKPDVILSAIGHGARCLVLCGQQAPMLYIVDRARHEEVTILLSPRSTTATMHLLENVYERTRFQGQFKLERMQELLTAHAALDPVLAALSA